MVAAPAGDPHEIGLNSTSRLEPRGPCVFVWAAPMLIVVIHN